MSLYTYVAQLIYTMVRLEWSITGIFANLKVVLTFHLFLLLSIGLVPIASKVTLNRCLFYGIIFIFVYCYSYSRDGAIMWVCSSHFILHENTVVVTS